MLLEAHFPVFARIGQFGPHILSLEKQTNRVRTREMLCIPQKLVERRTGAGCDDIEIFCRRGLHSRILDSRIQFEPVANDLQKSTLFGGRFEQGYLNAPAQESRQYQPWKASAAPEIGQRSCIFRNVCRELGTIPDMSPPDICQRDGRNEILATVPVLQQTNIGL